MAAEPVQLFDSDPHGRRYAGADRERAYQLWRSTAGRSYRKVSDSLGIALSTVAQWARRDGWVARAEREDAAERESVRSYVGALFEAEVERSVRVIRDLRDGATNEKVRFESATFLLAMAGHAPVKQTSATLRAKPRDDADISAPTLTPEERRAIAARLFGPDHPDAA